MQFSFSFPPFLICVENSFGCQIQLPLTRTTLAFFSAFKNSLLAVKSWIKNVKIKFL